MGSSRIRTKGLATMWTLNRIKVQSQSMDYLWLDGILFCLKRVFIGVPGRVALTGVLPFVLCWFLILRLNPEAWCQSADTSAEKSLKRKTEEQNSSNFTSVEVFSGDFSCSRAHK